MVKKKMISRIPKEILSKKILSMLLDDFALFGSIPFYLAVTLFAHFTGNRELFLRLIYSAIIAFLSVLVIKKVHYKDRPQKEEFTIFMERMVASSFPSTHSLFSTMLLILLSIAYPYVWVVICMAVFSILVYIQRYASKKHFFVDILGGILLAAIIVIFVIKVL